MMGRKNSFIREEAYQESLKILGNCITPDGFYASAIARTNRKSARDYLGAINWANYQSKGKEKWGVLRILGR